IIMTAEKSIYTNDYHCGADCYLAGGVAGESKPAEARQCVCCAISYKETAMVRRQKIVSVNDKMQRGYRYALTAPMGRNFDPQFRPELTPKEMLALGVFCGKYMTDCRKEFPASWFADARLSPSHRDCSLNYFGVDASQPLSVWRRKGWIHPDDP